MPDCALPLSQSPWLIWVTDGHGQFWRKWALLCSGADSRRLPPECPPPSDAPADPVAASLVILYPNLHEQAIRRSSAECALYQRPSESENLAQYFTEPGTITCC